MNLRSLWSLPFTLITLAPQPSAQAPIWNAELTCVVQVAELPRAVDWYRDKLGFELEWRDDKLGFAELFTPVAGVRIGLARHVEPSVGSGVVLTFGVFDIESAHGWFVSQKVAVDAVQTIPGLVELMTLRDPDGNVLQLFENLRPRPEQAGLEAVAFLAGSWVQARDGARGEEHWTAPIGGMMLGMSRIVRDDVAVFFEYLRIEKRGDKVVYVALPSGRPETVFDLDPAQCGTRRAVFVNPDHDFPKRISYWIGADASLRARIDDGTDAGEHRDFQWKRGGLL